MKNIIKILEKSGDSSPHSEYLVYGNPAKPKFVILFEKGVVFEKAVRIIGKPSDFLLMSTLGVPSEKCLRFIESVKSKNIFYFGDMDPISFFTYLTVIYGNRNPSPKDKKKSNVRFCGITLQDCKKYLSDRDTSIKLPDSELRILDFLKDFNIPELKGELEFLKEKKRKIEIDSLNLYGIEKYLERKFSEFEK